MPAKTPEEQAAYDAARKRGDRVHMRFAPADAERLRKMAAASGLPLSDYVLSLLSERPAPVVDLAAVAQLSAVVATLAEIPKSIRDLEADLGRLSGRLSHLFTMNPVLAREHEFAINEVFFEIKDLMAKVLPQIDEVQMAVAEPRAQIADVMKILMGDLARRSFSSRRAS